jgi:O-antigen/teichoic acid export membrane protein
VFYDYLGSDVLGLDTTASSLLSFLNLAELGVGGAVGYFLYQPLFDKDRLTINEIVSLQGWIYRRIAYVIMAAAFILMCFFPIIFKGISLPMWYPYATFLVMLFGALLGYFVNYRQCVLTADQKGYKVTRITSGAGLGFKILLVFILPIVPSPFLFYIGTNLAGTIFGSLWLNYVLKKEYPWLRKAELSGRQLLKKYPGILKKTSQLFFHQIATFIVFKCSPLIMYAYTSLTSIAYFGNYSIIIDKAKDILGMAFSSSQAAVGNLIASHDRQHALDVFWEMNDSRVCISTSALLILTMITEPFISVWLSSDYLLGHAVLYIMGFNAWLMINRDPVGQYVSGFGLFQDVWAPIVEALINFGVAIFFGRLYGIAGVLLGSTVSNLIIMYGWKPYFLFTRGFRGRPIREYYLPCLYRYILAGINVVAFIYLNKIFKPQHINNFLDLTVYGLILTLIIMPVMYLEFYLLTPGTRRFNQRLVGMLKGRFK